MSARVDVIVPTFNGWHHLDGCLTALEGQAYRSFRVVVVDDASTDGTPELLRDRWPQVKVLPLRHNVGLAAAVNLALDRSTSEFVALLNNDTEPEAGWLDSLVCALDRHPEAVAVTSKLRLFDRRDHIHSAGDTYARNGQPGNRGVWQRDMGQFDREEVVFGACAGAALYRRSALDEVAAIDGDVLDRDFYMYCEDVDLSWRLRLLGYTVIYVPDAVVYHRLSATGGGPLASYYVARNTICVMVKDLPTPLLLKNAVRITANQLFQLVHAGTHVREPAARAQIRGTLAALATIPRMLKKRRRIQRHRKVELKELEQLILP